LKTCKVVASQAVDRKDSAAGDGSKSGEFLFEKLSPETKGITLQVAPAHYGGLAIHLGEASHFEGATAYQASASVPYEWHTITIDLWQQLPENQRGKPFNIGAMSLGAIGGPAAIDKIRLGRTNEDLAK
jgi:hypothetical protein